MATVVIPFRREPAKTRLVPLPSEERARLAFAMLADVRAACARVAAVVLAEGPGGQGAAVWAALRGVQGPVAIVNADLPCATPADVERLLAAAPALVPARDGTTNALALLEAADFRPLYGPGSAGRFAELGFARVEIENLVDDVDTLADLDRLAARAGPRTRAALDGVSARA